MPKDTPQVDHRAKALRLLEESYSAPAESLEQAGRDAVATAQVHASLAIAEGQERVAEELQGVRRTLVAMRTGSPVDAVEASEVAASPIPRRERAVNELLELAKLADNEVMKGELEGLASRFSLPPVRDDRA